MAHGEGGTNIKKKPHMRPDTVPIDTSMGPCVILLVKSPVYHYVNLELLKNKSKNHKRRSRCSLNKIAYVYVPLENRTPNRMPNALMDTMSSRLDAAISKVFTPFTSP